jgi:uncharacterized protein YukE
MENTVNDNQILNLVDQTSKTFYKNDARRNECKKALNFLSEQLNNPQPTNGMTKEEFVNEIHRLQTDLNKLISLLDEADAKLRSEFEERGLGVICSTADMMKEFLPYFK